MRCVVFAYQEIGYVCLDALLRAGAEVVAVISHTDDPGERIWFRSVRELAAAHGLPVFEPESVNTPEWVARIREWNPDWIFSFYYRKLLPNEILASARHGALNLHGSLLPKYRGRCPANWVLVHGESETGVTLHYMEEKPDRGDIVAQRVVPIAYTDTAATLSAKLAGAAAELMRDTYPLLCAGRAPRTPQDHSAASYFGGRRPADGVIRWEAPARAVYNLVRAVTHPFPGAFTRWRGRRLFVWAADEDTRAAPSAAAPGTIVRVSPDVAVETGNGRLRLRRVQPETEDELDAADWARRHEVHEGETFT